MSDSLERFSPGLPGEIWYEHWHRYHWARPLVSGLRIADAACGEGYGSALLAASAREVTGIDIDAAVVQAARDRYAATPGLTFTQGDLSRRLPFDDGAFEALVSFETIEHLHDPAPFVAEMARLLAPGGFLLVSSPNRETCNPPGAPPNPHHHHEMDEAEFRAVLAKHFPAQRFFAQAVDFLSVIAPLGRAPHAGEMVSATSATAANPKPDLREAKYFICACARDEASLSQIGEGLSVLQDEAHYVLSDHRRMLQAMAHWSAERQQLHARLAAVEQALARMAIERNRALLALPRDA